MRSLAFPLLLLLAAAPAAAQPASAWAAHAGPSPAPARVIGTTSLGCLAGGEALPPEGPGWQAVRLSRNRNWGHPDTIRTVRVLAQRVRGAGLPDLLIGDIAQPRGGPLPFGHASHQSGLDVDVWLDVAPRGPLTRAQREDWPVASLVLPDQSAVDPRRFTESHARLIRLAAELPNVDRVLVNHGIKRGLCARHPGAPWLRKLRPWRGHDSHMHVRLRCPAGSPECQEGPPIPAGDGCDASLDWWLSDEARRPPSPPRAPGPPPALPAACGPVFRAR